jgi:hypothetical protein
VLRGLIWKLARENGHLARYIQEEYKDSGKKLFEDPNVLRTMWSILSKMLNDSTLSKVYVLIDALDECDTGRDQLLQFIVKNASDPSSKAKWLLSSRNYPEIKEFLNLQDRRRILNLELNHSHISRAVNAFIDYKTNELATQKAYKNALKLEVKQQLSEKAESTFLWVALACKMLRNVPGWMALFELQKLPPGLQPLYTRMMDQILLITDLRKELCLRILRLVGMTYRPLVFEELVVMAELPRDLLEDDESLKELIGLCGSFITTQESERTVYFVHQSAKDYLVSSGRQIIPSSIRDDEHGAIVRLSLEAMSNSLQRDICKLELPGALVGKVFINRDLKCIGYACRFWVDHLAEYLQKNSRDMSQYYEFLSDEGSIKKFLFVHLLHWLEALGWMGKTSEGIRAISSLEALIPVSILLPYTRES